ncbi:MAG: class I SAM-dependent methyltransferase [Candidatus Woesearchaeota archaeon]
MGDWSDYAKDYEEKVFSLTSVPQRRRQIVERIQSGKVLNMGCGSVPYLNQDLIAAGNRVVASDLCPEMLRESMIQYTHPDLSHMLADSRDIPERDCTFDTVVSVNSILPPQRSDADHMFSEAYRVLKPEGILVAFLVAYSNPKRLDDILGLGLKFDEEQKRMWDTGEWQCYHDPDTISRNMTESGFLSYTLEKVWLKTKNETGQLSRIYGYDAAKTLSFEWLLSAVK